MDGKMLARLGAVVFVVITATVVEQTRARQGPQVRTLVREPNDINAQLSTLRRCRDMGEAATRDPVCLNVWAEARDRFLGQGPAAARPDKPTALTTEVPTTFFPTEDPTAKESAPVAHPEPTGPEVR